MLCFYDNNNGAGLCDSTTWDDGIEPYSISLFASKDDKWKLVLE